MKQKLIELRRKIRDALGLEVPYVLIATRISTFNSDELRIPTNNSLNFYKINMKMED